MPRLFALLLALLLALPAWAAPGPAIAPADLSIPSETFRLDNGLTVVVHEDRSVPIVAVHVWYQVGSRNERRGRTGFAHLFEHFFFNGSENHPHGFREAMDDLGATTRNGTTNTADAIGLRLRSLRANAEARAADGDLNGAIDRFRAAQTAARGTMQGQDFIEASIIDSRLRDLQAQQRALAAEERESR